MKIKGNISIISTPGWQHLIVEKNASASVPREFTKRSAYEF